MLEIRKKKNRNYLIQIKVANIKIQSLMCVSMYIYITKKKKKLREVSSPYSVSEKLRMGNRRRKRGANDDSEKYQVRTVLVRN